MMWLKADHLSITIAVKAIGAFTLFQGMQERFGGLTPPATMPKRLALQVMDLTE